MADERLQKILAAAGIASRRAAEEVITAGRVRVNGRLVRELGIKANPKRDRIEVDGQVITRERLVYVVLNKPKEVMSTLKDPEGRATVVDLVRIPGARVSPVGRLDYHTSGVLLLTNDGEFSAKLQHPRYGVPKRYSVKVQGEMDERTLVRWRESIMIDGRATVPAEVTRVRTEDGKTWLNISLREGRNRHIRQLAEHAGSRIMRLVRFEYAGITAEGLHAGQWRYLNVDELKAIKAAHGVPKKVAAPAVDAEEARAIHSVPFRNSSKGAKKRFADDDDAPPRRAYKAGEDARPNRNRRDVGVARGRDSGPTRGRDAGPTRGRDSGPTRGRDSGPTRGRDSGSTRGRDSGSTRGRDTGPTRGRDTGPARGRDAAGRGAPSRDTERAGRPLSRAGAREAVRRGRG
ncbi:MAG: pseudouridine synthase [Polyangiaceae bacterium]|nr:pseudouridine synthase [Polyangiaceae bacterium]